MAVSQVTYPTLNSTAYSLILGCDANHKLTSLKGLDGNTSTFSYNSADNSLAWEKDSYGNQTTFTYNYDGLIGTTAHATTITDANGHKTVHYYSNGRLDHVFDALNNAEYYT